MIQFTNPIETYLSIVKDFTNSVRAIFILYDVDYQISTNDDLNKTTFTLLNHVITLRIINDVNIVLTIVDNNSDITLTNFITDYSTSTKIIYAVHAKDRVTKSKYRLDYLVLEVLN